MQPFSAHGDAPQLVVGQDLPVRDAVAISDGLSHGRRLPRFHGPIMVQAVLADKRLFGTSRKTHWYHTPAGRSMMNPGPRFCLAASISRDRPANDDIVVRDCLISPSWTGLSRPRPALHGCKDGSPRTAIVIDGKTALVMANRWLYNFRVESYSRMHGPPDRA